MKKTLKVTNARVQIPPFHGWGNSQYQFDNHFYCDEMLFPEPIKDGKVTLNNMTFKVIFDEDVTAGNVAVEGGTAPASLEMI